MPGIVLNTLLQLMLLIHDTTMPYIVLLIPGEEMV